MPKNSQFSHLLLHWYEGFGRKNLPWQNPITPYGVWVSEVMLQQTQVKTVIPYFKRFMQRFTDISSLGNADLDEVLVYWAGLGYYSRGRNLHKAAKILVKDYAGKLPEDLAQLQALPGIGRSTAGAIVALSMNQKAAILDGNVKRVLTRVYAISGWPEQALIKKQLWVLAEKLTPNQEVGKYTQAIMDLGATVCTRGQPKCGLCPVQSLCKAFKTNKQAQYPSSKTATEKPVRKIYLLMAINAQHQVLLIKRPLVGVWAGLWSLPELSLDQDLNKQLKDQYDYPAQAVKIWPQFRHSFSHYHLDISPIQINLEPNLEVSDNSQRWQPLGQIEVVALPAPVKKLVKALEKQASLR